MSPDAKSALVRACRTAVQVIVAWLITALVARMPWLSDVQDSLTLVLWIVLAAAFAAVWRRWIDPTSVPSLIDPDTAAMRDVM